jgi:hypothetical protein
MPRLVAIIESMWLRVGPAFHDLYPEFAQSRQGVSNHLAALSGLRERDPAAVRAAIRGGFAESRILELHGQRMLERDFLPGGQVKTQIKDLQNALCAAAAAHVALPLTALALERYRSIGQALPRADHAAALLALEQLNPGHRLGQGPDRLPD